MTDKAALKQALQLEPLLAAALQEAPAKEFRDLSFLPNLEQVLAIPTRINLSERGLMGMYANNIRFLVNRLRYEADVEKHPEILEEDVSDPIVVLGLPRSGTTKLQRFLSSDPNLQSAHAYRMFNPAPFPGEEPGNPVERIAWTQKMMSAVTNTGDSYQVMHEFDALEADETSFIPLANFDYVMQYITAPDPEFLAWVRTVDRRSPLRWLKQMLQYLQWQDGGKRGRPWLLKNPGHTGEVAEMLDVFPKATFVISQRDLASTMGSSMRMMGEILQNSFDEYDPKQMADELVAYWRYELDRYQSQLQQLGEKLPLIKVEYNTCVHDAISVAKEVYALHGLPWTSKGEAAMRQWDANNPRHKLGAYSYQLEDYGWSRERVERAFGSIAEQWRGF